MHWWNACTSNTIIVNVYWHLYIDLYQQRTCPLSMLVNICIHSYQYLSAIYILAYVTLLYIFLSLPFAATPFLVSSPFLSHIYQYCLSFFLLFYLPDPSHLYCLCASSPPPLPPLSLSLSLVLSPSPSPLPVFPFSLFLCHLAPLILSSSRICLPLS